MLDARNSEIRIADLAYSTMAVSVTKRTGTSATTVRVPGNGKSMHNNSVARNLGLPNLSCQRGPELSPTIRSMTIREGGEP